MEMVTVGPLMKGAILSGLSGAETHLSDVPVVCPTGNCTFPEFSSLAACSSVVDATSDLRFDCGAKPDSDGDCNLTVQGLIDVPSFRRDNTTIKSVKGTPNFLWISASWPNTERTSSNVSPLLSEVYTVFFNESRTWHDQSFPDNSLNGIVAVKSNISLCVKTYSTKVSSGQTNTTLVNTHRDLPWALENRSYLGSDALTYTARDPSGHRFWMNSLNFLGLSVYFDVRTFYGNHLGQIGNPDNSSYAMDQATSDAASMIAQAVYVDQPNGTAGLAKRFANLETALSNACVPLHISPSKLPLTASPGFERPRSTPPP